MKKITRRIMQKCMRTKYVKPPFTKCPECGHEIFNNYDGYLKRCDFEESSRGWWKWGERNHVSTGFGALYEKNAADKRKGFQFFN